MTTPVPTGAPAPDVVIDLPLVATLLREQHPDLASLPLTVAAEGWDNVQVRIGADLVARLPRRALAVALLETEQRWLPVLAPLVPVATPVPVRTGAPSPAFPRPWTIARWIEGVRAADRARSERTAWAGSLALALAALHVPAPATAPHNPVRAVPLATRAAVADRLAGHASLARALPLWERGVQAPPWRGPATWVHGDPHPGNVLVTPGTPPREDSLAALLDFGDLSAGDPACDLAAAWLHFDVDGRAAFRRAYDEARPAPDPGRWKRAAAWALSMASSVLVLAPDDQSNVGWARETLAQLRDESA